jgi:leucyl-tRNA synthetase
VNTLAAPLGEAGAGRAGPELLAALRQAVEFLIAAIAPVTPHLAEECWRALGGEGMVAQKPWPEFDPALVEDQEITLPVQVNGKKRADLTVPRDADHAHVEEAALRLDAVRRALDGRPPRKVIVVPQRSSMWWVRRDDPAGLRPAGREVFWRSRWAWPPA